jgi:hypothetical protein
LGRQETIYELIDSEDDYVNDLSIIISVHIPKLRASGLVPEKDISVLFSNTEQILSINKEFLRLLQERRKATPLVEKVGDVFLKMVPIISLFLHS